MQRKSRQNILVLGAGHFGTCLAQHLALQGHQVHIWTRSPQVAESICQEHRNPKYLSKVKLAPALLALCELAPQQIAQYAVVVLAIPTQALRSVLQLLQAQQNKIKSEQLLICAAKGIEIGTEKLPSHIIEDVCGAEIAQNLVALSGPSFAQEIAEGQPTGVSMASKNLERAQWGQQVFHSPQFRVYTSEDPIGLEVAGALKNVIAIAAGACAGLGFQANSRATLITRGLAELTRVGMALGADPLTFKGLGGVGDLFLTCSSEKSRNFTVGYRLGRGEALTEVLQTVGSVAEGVTTARSAFALGERLQVAIPITTAVYQVLYENKAIRLAVEELMNRDARPEQG